MEEYIINNMINLHNKMTQPLYYNGYISTDERVEIREYINTLEQTLNEIREHIDNMKCEFELNSYVTDFVIKLDNELQIIDEVLGEEK